MDDLRLLGVGALLCNALPHLCNGLSGRCFPTPFLRGGGSHPVVNVVWGTGNLFLALLLLFRFRTVPGIWGLVAGTAGFLAAGVLLAVRFRDAAGGAGGARR